MMSGNVFSLLAVSVVQMFNGEHMWGMGWMAFWWVSPWGVFINPSFSVRLEE